ncbi:uncharacterized protein TNCV_1906991 [Trichonephila clavipes]|nr:uncharacterized protein TNCV_1906991 [Trichonephila clavipes]
MSKYLPLKDFVWSDNDLTEQDILNLSDESDVGYILEVDLEYPSDLHDKHSDFPLAPENKPPPNCKEPRLLTTLEPKTKYVLHYSNLKLYLKLGEPGTRYLSSNVREIDHYNSGGLMDEVLGPYVRRFTGVVVPDFNLMDNNAWYIELSWSMNFWKVRIFTEWISQLISSPHPYRKGVGRSREGNDNSHPLPSPRAMKTKLMNE